MTTAARLAQRYGTPLYRYDLDDVAAAADDLRSFLPEPVRVYYSLKANPHPRVVGRLAAAGCGADISSEAEREAATGNGIAARDCLYTGPGKSQREIDLAAAAGVGLYSVESVTDAGRVARAHARAGRRARCLLRVNRARPSGGAGFRMGGAATQFGVSVEAVPAALDAIAAMDGCELVGLHCYELSNAPDEDALTAALTASVELATWLRDRHGAPLRVLDLGGGFGMPYARAGERPAYPKLRQRLADALDRHLPGWRSGVPALIVEAGRYLVGGCGKLITRVVDIKHSKGETFVVLDAGINHLGGLSGLRRTLPVAARPSAVDPGAGPEVTVNLVGPLCTPVDVLARGMCAPVPRVGQALVVDNVGAYGATASLLGFLSRPGPVEVAVAGGRVVDVSRLAVARIPASEARR